MVGTTKSCGNGIPYQGRTFADNHGLARTGHLENPRPEPPNVHVLGGAAHGCGRARWYPVIAADAVLTTKLTCSRCVAKVR